MGNRSKKSHTPWRGPEMERLRRLIEKDRLTMAAAGAALGRSYSSVRYMCGHLGLRSLRRWTKAEDATLRRMASRGQDDDAIGRALGRGASGVRRRRVYALRVVRRRPLAPADKERMEELWMAGERADAIAAATGFCEASVRNVLRARHGSSKRRRKDNNEER